MSKAVMISIQPKWCELIANGKKTIEVRKTKPKLETPFKCYIYCTLGDCGKVDIGKRGNCYNGKVIGEFVCEKTTEFYPTTDLKQLNPIHFQMCEKSCVDMRELYAYANSKKLYGLHISDLVIYDKPKELSDFMVEGECYPPRCSECKYFDKGNGYNVEDDCLLPHHLNEDGNDVKPLFKAPQSWCYVEDSIIQ